MTSPNTEREIRRRRRYAPSFKAKIVAACLQGDASIAQVALQHGLNTNLVQTWIRKARRQSQLPTVSDFVSLPVPPFTPDFEESNFIYRKDLRTRRENRKVRIRCRQRANVTGGECGRSDCSA
ncbi:IS66-like element accessory protein TnpA, partial [Halomonas icarae]